MTIWLSDGTKATVEDVSNESLEEPVTVYNFEVEDFHTYFVGETGVLVHNSDCGPDGSMPKKADAGESGSSSELDGVRIINKKYAGKTYELTGELADKYPKGVEFSSEGFPDFEPYSIKKVTIDGLEGDAYYDFIKENEAAGFSSTPKGYTWHHVEDGQTLILVPSDLHGAVRHTGGASLIRQGIRP